MPDDLHQRMALGKKDTGVLSMDAAFLFSMLMVIVVLLGELVLRIKGRGLCGRRPFSALSAFVYGIIPFKGKKDRDRRSDTERLGIFITFLFFVNVLSVVMGIKDMASSREITDNTLFRGEAGGDTKTVVLEAKGEGIEEEISFEVEPRQLSYEEAQRYLDNAGETILKEVKGENKSLEKITKDLNFVRTLENGMVDVRWIPKDPELIDRNGKINTEALSSEYGTATSVSAILRAGTEERETDIHLVLYKASSKMPFREQLLYLLEEKEKSTRENGELKLPEEIDGRKISWSVKDDVGQKEILAAGLLIICLLPVAWIRKNRIKEEAAAKELKEDYPDFAYKLVLYLDSGVGIANSLSMILRDMEKRGYTERRLPLELRRLVEDIRNGGDMEKALEGFGNACGFVEYMRLSGMVSHFAATGDRDIKRALSDTGREAMMIKNELLKRKGEEASLKLLGPIMLLMVSVMIAVMFPALSTISF